VPKATSTAAIAKSHAQGRATTRVIARPRRARVDDRAACCGPFIRRRSPSRRA
jgi:hypothetical protein